MFVQGANTPLIPRWLNRKFCWQSYLSVERYDISPIGVALLVTTFGVSSRRKIKIRLDIARRMGYSMGIASMAGFG
jgi:hypothetical protein